MPKPLPISVVIPAYNRERLLARALRSVERQRPHRPLEVIVVDDCSTDRTSAVAEHHGARVVRHARNRGEGEARNSGIAEARGEWIALLDSDDEWLPDHLDRLWRNRAGLVLVADSALACAPDEVADRIHGAAGDSVHPLESPAALIWPENPVPASGGLVATAVARAAGGYRPLPHCADLDFLLRCLEHGRGALLPEVGVLYHVHPEQISSDRETMQAAHARVCGEYADRPWWSRRAFERWKGVMTWDRFQERRRGRGALTTATDLLGLLRHPQRVAGLVGVWRWRMRLRRRSWRMGRDGGPSLALLADLDPPAGWEGARVVDLRDSGRVRALARLARRPTASAVADGFLLGLALRTMGIQPCPARGAGD